MTLGMISWGGVYYAASAHPKQYFCPLSSRHWITHGQACKGGPSNLTVRSELEGSFGGLRK